MPWERSPEAESSSRPRASRLATPLLPNGRPWQHLRPSPDNRHVSFDRHVGTDISEADDQSVASIRVEYAFFIVLDAIFSDLPVIGRLSGYVFHPKYLVSDTQDQPLMRLTKRPAFFEGKFELEKLQEMDSVAELGTIMSLLMMTLLEKRRG